MHRIPFDLRSVRLARTLKNSSEVSALTASSARDRMHHARVVQMFETVPDAVLARLEVLLVEREQLKQMISTLLQRVA